MEHDKNQFLLSFSPIIIALLENLLIVGELVCLFAPPLLHKVSRLDLRQLIRPDGNFSCEDCLTLLSCIDKPQALIFTAMLFSSSGGHSN